MRDGKVLPLPVTPAGPRGVHPGRSRRETYVLQQVVLWGTGTAAGDLGTPVAGKTGTTENSTDGWFIGYTPNLTTAVWMGYAGGSTSPWTASGASPTSTGGTIPAELWHDYMEAALTSEPQYAGQFPLVYYLGGQTLTPPGPGNVSFPLGLGTTTTTTTTVPTTVPASTTVPSSTSVPKGTTVPSTTAPVRTTTPVRTTVPTGTTVPAKSGAAPP